MFEYSKDKFMEFIKNSYDINDDNVKYKLNHILCVIDNVKYLCNKLKDAIKNMEQIRIKGNNFIFSI